MTKNRLYNSGKPLHTEEVITRKKGPSRQTLWFKINMSVTNGLAF